METRLVRCGITSLALIGAALAQGGPASADGGSGHRPAPRIESVTASPAGSASDAVTLPMTSGTEHFSAQVTGASRVKFVLDKAGKGNVTIADDRTPADGFTADYSFVAYSDSITPWICSQLILEVSGPGGHVRQVVMDVYNDRPAGS